jgi:UDP-glucose 4-epimerase
MTKVIVTGGAGFIGSHIVEYLLEKTDWSVVVIDNMVNGQEENIEMFQNNLRYKFYKMDVAKNLDSELFADVDYVFHMAGLADIVPSIENPLEYHEANVTGTLKTLEASRKSDRLKKFVYAASSSCYGIPDKFPTPETEKIKPEYPYATTKYFGEEYVFNWNKIYGLPAVSLRFFNVYGPRARNNNTYGAVFKVFLTQKLNGIPLTIVGDGEQKRDFIFVKDIAEAAYLAATSEISGQCINLGAGNPRSINELAGMISDNVVHIPKRPGEPDVTWADISKAQQLLNWSPKIPLEKGVKIMLDNIEYWREAPLWTPEKIKEATVSWFKYLKEDSQ